MKTNDTAFCLLPEIHSNQTYRDYPIHEESLILAMIDVTWAPPYSSNDFHRHSCMEIGLCLEGNGVIFIHGKDKQSFQSGSVVIIPKGAHHSQQNMGQPSTRWRYIAINEDLLTQDAPARCRIEISRLLRFARSNGILLPDQAMATEIVQLIQHMFEIKSSCSNTVLAELESIVLLILSRVARDLGASAIFSGRPSSITHAIDPALQLVTTSYQQDIRVEQMARACALSESHFRKVFVQIMGVSPLEYLNRYRIKRSMHLLQTTAAPISLIAEECGFPTITTFNRNFLRYNSISPSQWRNDNLINNEISH